MLIKVIVKIDALNNTSKCVATTVFKCSESCLNFVTGYQIITITADIYLVVFSSKYEL